MKPSEIQRTPALAAAFLATFILYNGVTAAPPPNLQAVAEVATSKRTVVRASWWGFDPVDATAALQAAINSGAHELIVENVGAPWITDKPHVGQ